MINKKEAGILLPKVVTEGIAVHVLPDERHEYLMTTKEVAYGYGVSDYAIRKALLRNSSELVEGKHFIKGLDILSNPFRQPHQVFFTKRGVVRLGFFIRSKRAKVFRDWAEELVVKVDELAGMLPMSANNPKTKRLINRLDRNRMVRLLAMTAKIDDSELRNGIVNELMGGFDYGTL
ncbi:MAG: Bro-N domain-containing protein [Bacteroidales bacterium]|jgi:hypothetical protein|nr:Bro-N domain-containing protein [Bacteroidales bacterium]